MDRQIAKGTVHVCPYSGNVTIVSSINSIIDKSQCEYSAECTIEHCPLEEELNRF